MPAAKGNKRYKQRLEDQNQKEQALAIFKNDNVVRSVLEKVPARNFAAAGKAIVSQVPALMGKRKSSISKAAETLFMYEEPDTNLRTLEKMYNRLTLAQRAVQTLTFHIMQGGVRLRPPSHILKPGMGKIPDKLEESITFISQWQRWIGFDNTMVKVVLYWIIKGNSYLEVVHAPNNPWKIIELKPIPADQMRVVRDATGQVLGYLQFPPNITPLLYTYNQGNWTEATETGAIFFKPGDIIHLKFMPLESAPYGRSILEAAKDPLAVQTGMLEDIGIIIRNYAAPLLFFTVGSETMPANQDQIEEIAGYLTQQLEASANLVASGIVQGEVLAPGTGTMNLEKYYSQAVRMVITALGVPPTLMGFEDVGEASAKIQLEGFTRMVRVLRNQLDYEIEMRIFPLLMDNIPIDMNGLPVVMPEHMDLIPQVDWEPIETEEERRIRLQNEFKLGLRSRQETRIKMGEVPEHLGDLVLAEDLPAQTHLLLLKQATTLTGRRDDTGGTQRGKSEKKPSDRDQEYSKAKGKVPAATRKNRQGESENNERSGETDP